jgi:hypothetical protein
VPLRVHVRRLILVLVVPERGGGLALLCRVGLLCQCCQLRAQRFRRRVERVHHNARGVCCSATWPPPPVRPHATNPSSSAVRVWRRCSEERFHVQTPTRIQETTTPRAAPPAPSTGEPATYRVCAPRHLQPDVRPSLVHAEAAEGLRRATLWAGTSPSTPESAPRSATRHTPHTAGQCWVRDHHPCGRTVAR